MADADAGTNRAAIHVLLVDALNLIRRVYAAQPGDDGPERAEGALAACRQSLKRAVREADPTHAVIVFEGPGPTWRHEALADYKAGHKPMPQALHDALPAYREAFAEDGVQSFELPSTEADDVIATLATKTAAAGGKATILSTDKVLQQLVSPQIRVRDHFKKHTFTRDDVIERFGVSPGRLVALLALAGDATSGIRGIPGIGIKTGAKLIRDFGSLDWVLATAAGEPDLDEDLPPLTPRLAAKLVEHADDARLARSLFRLRVDLDLGLSLATLRYVS